MIEEEESFLKKSDTQYCFGVDLRPRSLRRGVALLGHHNLLDLHNAICKARGLSSDVSFSFRIGSETVEETRRLDELNVKEGQTIVYLVASCKEERAETVVVDAIDDD